MRSDNSAEYLALLWGHYYDLLIAEQQRCEAVRSQVEAGLAHHSIGNQAIDYSIYQQVKDKSCSDLDKMAFVAAVRQVIPNGGQIAITGLSVHSPRTLYVASHNRPVFIVRRIDNNDVMVVSDINAAMGLFPQELIHTANEELKHLDGRSETESLGKDKKRNALDAEKNKLLEHFRVEVYPLDGEEIFAELNVVIKKGEITREILITGFDGFQTAEVEPFITLLNPVPVRKDFDRSFYDTHLEEVPSRLREIMQFYRSEERPPLEIPLQQKAIRRRFGKTLNGLKRLVLIGTGSSYNIGQISQLFIHALMPEMDVIVLRPGDIEDLSKFTTVEKDLVVLLSWSSTTAEMVQTAKRNPP